MKKKNSPLKMFMKGFFRSFFIIVVLLLVGFGSYKLTMFYYKVEGPPKNLKGNRLIKEIVSDATVDEVSKNLIFSSDKVSGEIKDMVLEIVNTNTNNIDYITIPADTQITLDNNMYQRLYASNPEIPQIVSFFQMYKYIDEDYIYDFGTILFETYYDVDISYYTGMEEGYFNTIFEDDGDKLIFTDEWKETFGSANTKEAMKELLKEIYDKAASNLSLKKKEEYIPAYISVNPDYIHYHSIYGEEKTQDDMADAKDMINEILNNDVTYTSGEEDNNNTENAVSTKGYNIKILNGSRITGLAAHFKDKLTLDGYNITGINNYNGETLNTTKIIVNSEDLGQDLIAYFKDPIIKVEQLEEGTDVEIILGTNDDVN